jgi:hypothetical protein
MNPHLFQLLRLGGAGSPRVPAPGSSATTRELAPSCRRRSEAGAALVEFALILPLLLTLMIGVLDFGKAFNYWIDETHLASEGARFAAVNSNPGASSNLSLQQWILSQMETGEQKAKASVCISTVGNVPYTVGNPIQVKVQYPHTWLPWLHNRLGFPTTVRISASATMRLEANYVPGADVKTCV